MTDEYDDDRTQRMDADDADLDDTGEATRALGRPTEETTQRVPGGADEFPTRRYDPATPVEADHTEILDIPPDPRAGRATGMAVAMVILAFLVAVAVGYATRTPHPPGLIANGIIGPNGGVLPFDGAGRLEVPRGALTTTAAIKIRRVSLDQDISLRRQDGTTQDFDKGTVTLYAFEPTTTTFSRPVTIRLPMKGSADVALVVSGDRVKAVAGTQQGDTFVITTTSFDFR